MLPLHAQHNRSSESGDSETQPFLSFHCQRSLSGEHVLISLVTSPHTLRFVKTLCEDFISGHKLTEVTFIVLFSSTQAWKFILKTHVIKLTSKTPFSKNLFETETFHILNICSGPEYLLYYAHISFHLLFKATTNYEREIGGIERLTNLPTLPVVNDRAGISPSLV